jgi:hypothetical protein
MRNRKRNLDRDINAMLEDTFETGAKGQFIKARALWAQYAGFMIANLDQLSAHPTWLAGYRQGIAKGMDHADASYHADQIVRNAHGSSGLADLPAMFRGKGVAREALGWTTLFGTYWNHVYNQIQDKGRMGVEGLYTKDSTKFIAGVGGLMGYFLANTISHELTRSKGTIYDEDGNLTWASGLGFAAHGVVQTAYSLQPIVRDIGYYYDVKHERGSVEIGSALNQSLTTITKGMKEAFGGAIDVGMGEDTDFESTFNALRAPGYALGLGPTDYMVKLGKYAFGDGRAVDTPWEAWRLMLDAQLPPKKRKKSK